MTAWATALRIARREARKSAGRSVLVLAMIALPIAFLSFAAVNIDMFDLTEKERLDRQIGRADVGLSWVAKHPVAQTIEGGWSPVVGEPFIPLEGDQITEEELLAELPPGSRVIRQARWNAQISASGGLVSLPVRVLDVGDPMTRGIAETQEGRPARGENEVMINAAASRLLGAGLGDTVRGTNPHRDYLVVGIVEFPDNLGSLLVFNSPSHFQLADRPMEWLADTPAPMTLADLERLNRMGITAASREWSALGFHSTLATNPEELATGFLAGGLVTLEVVLLAGPAFAISARRRAHDLALIAAAGGEPKHLRRVVLAEGLVLGATGAVIGILCGTSLAVLARPIVEELMVQARAGGYRFFPMALAAIALLAIGTGMLAAAVPAFIAARQDVVRVLNGRRGVLRSRRRWIVAGLVMVAAGTAIAALGATRVSESLMLLGIVLAELGLVVLTPALVGLVAKAGRWLPLSPRLALRDTARNRTAAAPAISAIMAAVAGAVAVGVFVAGQQSQQAAAYEPFLPPGHFTIRHAGATSATSAEWAEMESAVHRTLPSARMRTFSEPECTDNMDRDFCEIAVVVPQHRLCPYTSREYDLTPAEHAAARTDERCRDLRSFDFAYGGWARGTIVEDGDVLALLTGASEAEIAAAQRTLDNGGAVVTDDRLIFEGQVMLTAIIGDKSTLSSRNVVSVPGYLLTTAKIHLHAVVSPRLAESLGVQATAKGLVGTNGFVPSLAQEAQIQTDLAEIGPDIFTSVERGPSPYRDPTTLLLALAAAVIALGAAGIATGLATVDGRADLATLAAIGADPRVRRRLTLSRAGIIAGLGALLGTLAGLGGAGVLVAALNQVYASQWPTRDTVQFAFPWQSLMVIVAVPIAAMAGAALFTRAKLPIERRMM